MKEAFFLRLPNGWVLVHPTTLSGAKDKLSLLLLLQWQISFTKTKNLQLHVPIIKNVNYCMKVISFDILCLLRYVPV